MKSMILISALSKEERARLTKVTLAKRDHSKGTLPELTDLLREHLLSMDHEIQRGRLLMFKHSAHTWIEFSSIDTEQEVKEPLNSLTVVSWNVWEDERFVDLRHPFILQKLFEDSSLVLEAITLQEVTIDLFNSILAHPINQNEWLVMDLTYQLEICPNPYGTMVLIRKGVARGYACAAGFHEFANTRMQRGLNFIELFSVGSQRPYVSVVFFLPELPARNRMIGCSYE